MTLYSFCQREEKAGNAHSHKSPAKLGVVTRMSHDDIGNLCINDKERSVTGVCSLPPVASPL